MNPTMLDAMQHIEGLRGVALGKNGWRAWQSRLENWHPEQIIEAANQVAKDWMQASAWPIGHLLAKLPPVHEDRQEIDGFWWGIAGNHGGNWAKFEKLPADEREAIAQHLLNFGQTRAQVDLAERMAPGSFSRWHEKHGAKQEAA